MWDISNLWNMLGEKFISAERRRRISIGNQIERAVSLLASTSLKARLKGSESELLTRKFRL